jgi:hypothetical protein
MMDFAVGDRVLYYADASDRLDSSEAAGEIVAIVRTIALIRPDDCAVSGIMLTRQHLRDIRKET